MKNSQQNKQSDENVEFDISKITSIEQLIELIGKGKLTLEQLKTLLKIQPMLIQAAIQFMQSVINAARASGESQTTAMEAINRQILSYENTLKILAQNAESDTTREILADILMTLARENLQALERINQENNKHWYKVIVSTGIIILVALAMVFKNNSNTPPEE